MAVGQDQSVVMRQSVEMAIRGGLEVAYRVGSNRRGARRQTMRFERMAGVVGKAGQAGSDAVEPRESTAAGSGCRRLSRLLCCRVQARSRSAASAAKQVQLLGTARFKHKSQVLTK